MTNFKFSLFLLFLLAFVPFISSTLTWNSYGGELTYITHAQTPNVYSRLDTNVVERTLTEGYSSIENIIPREVLVSSFGDINNYYFVLFNGNYLQVFNEDLVLQNEKLVPQIIGQYATATLDGDDKRNDFVYLSRIDLLNLSLLAYEIGDDSSITFKDDFNFSLGESPVVNISSSGVRCVSDECFSYVSEWNGSSYTHYLFDFYMNGSVLNYTAYSLYVGDNSPLREPPNYYDWDNDGDNEFVVFSKNRILIYSRENGLEKTFNDQNVTNAVFYHPDNSNLWKLVVIRDLGTDLTNCGGGTYNCVQLKSYKIDGTSYFSSVNLGVSTNSADTIRSLGLAVGDYNDDGFDDIYTGTSKGNTNNQTIFKILKGSDGTELYSQTSPDNKFGSSAYPNKMLSIANMDSDNVLDFVGVMNNRTYIWSAGTNEFYYNKTTGMVSCIPVDLTFDNDLDVLCVSGSDTLLLTSNYTNINSVINTITFDPSTTINVGSSVYAFIDANDTEFDVILYSVRCSNTGNFSSEDTSDVKSCYYDAVGTYNMTLRVRDNFHDTYFSYSQIITVLSGGAEEEEPVVEQEYTQVEGGIAIPTQIVNPDDLDKGLLPNIYYGTLSFFSNVLQPSIILVFVIFFVLIMITFAVIIKKIGTKIAGI